MSNFAVIMMCPVNVLMNVACLHLEQMQHIGGITGKRKQVKDWAQRIALVQAIQTMGYPAGDQNGHCAKHCVIAATVIDYVSLSKHQIPQV